MFLIMFTFVYIYIDINDQVAILNQYGNGLRLVAFEWFQVSDLKSVTAMLLSSFSTDEPPCDWVHVVVGRASSLWLVSYGGRTKAHVDCTPTG